MHSQMPGNVLPSHKLNGNFTFTASAVTIGNDLAEKDPGVEQEGKKRQNLQLMREKKHGAKERKLTSPSSTLLTSLKWLNYIKRKARTVLSAGTPTTS